MSMQAEWDEMKAMFQSQRLAVLCSDYDGKPYSNLVAFAATADMKQVLFATPRESQKYRNIVANPSVALLVDNRNNEVADFKQAEAVTVLGAVDVEIPPEPCMVDRYLEKHSHLRDFINEADVSLLKVNVDRYILVQHFQDVKELRP